VGRSTSAAVVKTLIVAAEQIGAPMARIFAALELRREDLERFDLRVGYANVAAMWRELVAWSGDPMIGATIAERTGGSGQGGIFEYTARAAPSIDQAWARLSALLPLIFGGPDDFQVVTRAIDGGWEIGYRIPLHSDPPIPPSEEGLVVAFTTVCRQIAPSFAPDAMCFMHAPTAPVDEWRRVVGCAVEFGASFYGLRLGERAYRAPIRSQDPQLAGLLDRLVRPLVANAPDAPASPVDAVVRALRDRLDRGAPATLVDVAADLHVSTRTLQRQLGAAGTSLRAELDNVRCAIATARLRDGRTSVGEIAAALGFADASQLSRAVRRWTGASPREIRARRD
jgi:AraC-like DNA-binding protein